LQSGNSDLGWYHLYYGVPHSLGRAFLFLDLTGKEGDAPSEAASKARNYLRTYAGNSVAEYYGGHNTMMPALGRLVAGLYFKDTSLLQKSFDLARFGVVQVSSTDEAGGPNYGNLQKDWSFFEHGQGLNATYGHDGFMQMAKYLRIVNGTVLDIGRIAVPNDPYERTSIQIWTDWYKNFIRWAAYNGYTDPYIAQKNPAYNRFSKITRAIEAIKNTTYQEPKEYSGEMDLLIQKKLDFDGAMSYPVANYLTTRRKNPSFYASVRLVNVAMPAEEFSSFSSEMGNMLFITRNNSDRLGYDNILYYPSSVMNSMTFPEALLNDIHRPGREPWGGGGAISCGAWFYWGQSTLDGYWGMSAENISSSKINMKKSWFVFDDEIVALGSGISGSSVKTWIDTFEKKDSKLNTSLGQKSIDSTGSLGNLTWAHHDDTGYVFPDGETIMAERVNDNIADIPSNKRVPHKRYYIDHGSPSSGIHKIIYSPGASSSKTQSYSSSPDVEVLQLDDKLHLVKEKRNGVVGAAFFGSVTHNLVSSNLPAYILYRDTDSNFSFSLHNPNSEPKSLTQCGWRTGELIPTLSSKVDYLVSESQATKHNFSITLAKSFEKASNCQGCNLFNLSNNGRTINVSMRPFRKFEFDADGSGKITKAWISFNDAIEVDGAPVPAPVCGNGSCESGETESNCPQDCQISPPSGKKGDLDNDEDVDIFDYNLLVTNFSATGDNPADIDGDGDVDIFDYNILIENFGK